MKIDDVNDNFKWNTSDIFLTRDDWDDATNDVLAQIENFKNFKEKLNNVENLLEYYQFFDVFDQNFNKIFAYAMLNKDTNTTNTQYIEDFERVNFLYGKYAEATAFVAPELAKNSDDFYNTVLLDKRFAPYKYMIAEIMESRKHILSENEEFALATVAKFSNGFDEVYSTLTNADFVFKSVKKNGKTFALTEGTYGKFLTDPCENVRLQAYNNLYKTYNSFHNTISTNYIYFVKMMTSQLKLRHQTSVFDSKFEGQKISKQIYTTLLKNVDNHINLEKEYFKLLKNQIKVEKFGFKDVYLSLSPSINKKFSYAEQKAIVQNALSPLGKEYLQVVNLAFESRWIDVYPTSNKKSGGYMLGIYNVHPYILLNNNEDFESMSTLAHELGHAMHTHYSCKTQPNSLHDYATFIAEIASTVNEILLNKYMTKTAKTPQEKLFYVSQYLQHFKSTVFRQTMFSEFEDFAIKKVENDELLSPKILDEEYESLLKKHFGGVVPIDKNIIHEWTRIPHFYTPYYVFQYATSFISAVYIANSILENKNDMQTKYINMLCRGSDGYPSDILRETGVDLTNDEIYTYSFDDMKKSLQEAKLLIKQIKSQNENANALTNWQNKNKIKTKQIDKAN